MALEITSKKNTEERTNTPMVEGDYEVQLLNAGEMTSQSGTTYLKFEFVVRDDVDQRYKKHRVWRSYFKGEDGNYEMDKIGHMASMLGVPEGVKIELGDLPGRCCMVHVKPYKSPKTGRESDSVVWYAPTKAGQLIPSLDQFAEVDEGDPDNQLPF